MFTSPGAACQGDISLLVQAHWSNHSPDSREAQLQHGQCIVGSVALFAVRRWRQHEGAGFGEGRGPVAMRAVWVHCDHAALLNEAKNWWFIPSHEARHM